MFQCTVCMCIRVGICACVYARGSLLLPHFISLKMGTSLICTNKGPLKQGQSTEQGGRGLQVQRPEVEMALLPTVALLLCLLYPSLRAASGGCQRLQDLDSTVVHKDGQVILGGMFPIHSKGVEQKLPFSNRPGKRRCRG